MVVVDTAHDRGRLPGAVVVGPRRVVDHHVVGRHVLRVPRHDGGVGPPVGTGVHVHGQGPHGAPCPDHGRLREVVAATSGRVGGVRRRPRSATGQGGRGGQPVSKGVLGLRGGGGDAGGLGRRGLQVTGLEGCLPGGRGGHHCQGEIRGQVLAPARHTDLDGVGATGDELVASGDPAGVLAGGAGPALVPGGPRAVLTHPQVDRQALGQGVRPAPAEPRYEEAVHLHGIGQDEGGGARSSGRGGGVSGARVGLGTGVL